MVFRFLRRKKTPKVFVMGLDCAEPSLAFGRYRDDLPHPALEREGQRTGGAIDRERRQ